SDSLPHTLNTAVQLVQNLKKLQSIDSAYAYNAFDRLYSDVLVYVGSAIDRLAKEEANIGADKDSDSMLQPFSDIYQYLIEIISRHTESTVTTEDAYSAEHRPWVESAITRYLSKSFPSPEMRVAAWDWLPFWFIASGKQHKETAIQFVQGIRRFIRHAPAEDLVLRESPLGQSIVRRLASSSRDMRITAKDTLLAYSEDEPGDELTNISEIKLDNRAETIRIVLRIANEIKEPSMLEETLELVAGGIGCACSLREETLGDVASFLLGYYCKDNIFLRAVAMEQLLSIAQVLGISLTHLLKTVSSSVACTLAIALDQTSPQSFIRCMQLLGTSPRQFIGAHIDTIVPHLVAYGHDKALNSVAEILDVQLPVLCVNQAAVVFVKIFLMDDQLMHQVMLRFVDLISAGSEMDSDQVEVNIPSLLRSCSVKLVFSLILALGEESSLLRRRARSALLTVRHILDSSTSYTNQGVSTIVQHSVENMKDISAGQSPKPGSQFDSSSTHPGLAEFLSQHILGVLAHVNELLRNSEQSHYENSSSGVAANDSSSLKAKALRAIGELVALLGPNATPHTSSIVASLSPALGGPLTVYALRSWEILAESLVRASLSADLMNSLMVPLLTAFFTAPEDVRQMLSSTVNKISKLHEHNIKHHHRHICPIPDDPLLSASCDIYKRCSAIDPLRQKLASFAAMLKMKDSTLVLCASRALCLLLTQHPKLIASWKKPFYHGIDPSNPVLKSSRSGGRGSSYADAALVSNMANTLRSACNVGGKLGEMAAASCTACLAYIGGINVRAIEKPSDGYPLVNEPVTQSSSVFPVLHRLDTDEERLEFVCTLIIDHLSQTFARAPSPSVQTCAAYGIQELLKLVGFKRATLYGHADDKHPSQSGSAHNRRKRRDVLKRPRDSRSQGLQQRWELLPQNIKQVILPLLDSKYTIQSTSRSGSENKGERVPCITRSGSHLSWLRAWVVEMTNALPPGPTSSIFKVCTSIMKESSADTLLFFLPQAAYQYCIHRQGASSEAEIETIEIKDDDSDSGNEDKSMMSGNSSIQAHVLSSELQAVLTLDAKEGRMPVDQWRLCKEAALDLLDSFSAYVRTQQNNRVNGKRGTRKDSKLAHATDEELAILALTSTVSPATIANAAASCTQYERALQHMELSLREGAFGKYPTLFGNIDDATMASIQELYFGMDDADGVVGAASCRKQIDHRMLIRKYEVEGNWSHALIGHESLLQSQPGNEEFQRGWISCLQNMGQWESAWAASKELYQNKEARNKVDDQLKSACFAAAWRLGKWDWVQKTISDSPESHTALPSFDTLNSVLLLRAGHENESSLKSMSLPLPLQVCLGSGIGSSGALSLSSSLAELMNAGFMSVGHSIGEAFSGTLRQTLLSTATATASSDMHHEIHAHMLGDIAMFAEHVHGKFSIDDNGSHDCSSLQQVLNDLFRQWNERIACLPTTYSVQEPVLALHTRICDMLAGLCHRGNSIDARQAHCVCIGSLLRQSVHTRHQAAQLARLAGYRATALGILIHAETTCSPGSALLAPLQIEHSQILWDEGHSGDAIASMGRVVDALSAKLNMPEDATHGSSSMLGVGAGGASLAAQINDGLSPGPSSQSGLDASREEAGTSASLHDLHDTKASFAKASLLLSRWQDMTKSLDSGTLINRYNKLIKIQESDKVYYACGHLYDKLFSILSKPDLPSRSSKAQQDHRSSQLASVQYYVIRYYSRALMYSSRFLYQALPRLLTVWLDFGASILRPPDSKNSRVVDRFKTINRVMLNFAKRLPAYNFLVVLSQLVSRICHPNEDVFAVLEVIILSVLELYPQQALWQLMGVQRSTYAARSERCNAILAKARASHSADALTRVGVRGRNLGVSGLIQQASKLTDQLLGLCNSLPPARTITTMHMSRDFKTLAKSTPLDIIVPLQRCLVPALPDAPSGAEHELALLSQLDRSDTETAGDTSGGGDSQSALQQAMMLHQPFPSDLPTISGFEDEIEVMHSLQRPKRITVLGSDGQKYSFLCKPKDDLRKDARLMEFNSMINQLLSSQTQTHKRGLHIRTYAVVPLNEECGLIQWVGPTTGIRHVLHRLYKAHNVTISMPQVKSILDNSSPSEEEQFTKKLLPLFPSVLHEWFLQSFPEPRSWLASRTNFTRSAAVMSMVGYILGLGDRHCENILLNEKTGGVVHVDFNCLFEKGKTLEKPEKVPFRLTHNMVDAMGATGYEGAFRKTCEMTLGLLREHQDALMSVLESFLHDPLVEWSKRTTRSTARAAANKDGGGGQQPNEHASRSLDVIRKKLQGNQGSTPLSVEGQVSELIRVATDPSKLFQMYIGWAAYM
ncbi:hypothetical protein IW140_000342, partial [Coemansia sp. RSA 1813]